MSVPLRRALPAALALVATSLLLAGCTMPSSHHNSAAGAQSSTSTTDTPSPPVSTQSSTAAPTLAPTSSSAPHSIASATAKPGPDGVSGGGGSISTNAKAATVTRCTATQLRGSIADGGGTSGSVYKVAIILRNTSANTCTLQGWPGVSFVGNGNGTQIGNPATLDRSTAHPVLTLKQGSEVQSIVKIKQDSSWDAATCEPRVTDGFRVYPPGSTLSLFIGASGASYEACANKSIQQLSATALTSF